MSRKVFKTKDELMAYMKRKSIDNRRVVYIAERLNEYELVYRVN